MYINIKSNKLSTHKNQCNLKSRNEKKIFETNCWFDVFLKCTTHFSLIIGHFLGQPNEALLVLKDLQPNRPDKATYLTNHKKTWLAQFFCDLLDKSQKNWASHFQKEKKTTRLVCGKHKRKGCLDRPECPAQPS